jgi:hypothetical protein
MSISQAQIDDWFVFHPVRPGQQDRYIAIRAAAKHLAETIVANSAASPDQTAAIRKIREAVMTANQGIACEREDESASFVK